jgi:lipoprotein-anchoring transpeptidase ErfK/SrfK
VAVLSGVVLYGKFVSPVLEDQPVKTQDAVRPAASAPAAEAPARESAAEAADPDRPALISNRPAGANGLPATPVPEKGAPDELVARIPSDPELANRAQSLVVAGLTAEKNGQLLAARSNLSDALNLGLDPHRTIEVRAALERLGRETVFSSRIFPDDPLVLRHTIQSGETLAVIAKRYDVTDDFLAAINQIRDKHRIRAGQALKVVRGPFNVRISKKSYQMDVFLQKTFVKHYTVGLGQDNSTPTGEWIVGTKLTNPTYFPPRGGPIIAADDPDNPLGEHWIELRGIAGEAVSQERYGIHGTNEPHTVGQSASLGCVRMHNADVAEVYTYLVSNKSRVWIID